MTFRLTAPVPSESDIHEAVAKILDALLPVDRVAWMTYPAGLIELSPRQAARLARCGLKTGMPDIWIFYRGVWLIELKKPGGRLSHSRIVRSKHGLREIVGQVERFEQLCKTGAVRDIAICYSVADVLETIARWQIPTTRPARVAA
jgi:hypothetical protein